MNENNEIIEIRKKYLAVGDIADIANVSTNNISNWKNKDDNFPKPYINLSNGGIWHGKDIARYLSIKISDKNFRHVINKNLDIKMKKIAVIGRARTGKSLFVSMFVENNKEFLELFSGGGDDNTICTMITKIYDNKYDDLEYFVFSTDFNEVFSIITKNDNKVRIIDNIKYNEALISDILILKEKIKLISNINISQLNEMVLDKLNLIKQIIKKIKDIENITKKSCEVIIESYQNPSEFCREILYQNNLTGLEIIDTPGVSGKVLPVEIQKSDMYIFISRDENSDEATTIKDIVNDIKADVATSSALFLYRINESATEDEFHELKTEAKCYMEAFDNNFNDLKKDEIIFTNFDVLKPSDNCIPYPNLHNSKRIIKKHEIESQKVFLKYLKIEINNKLKNEKNTELKNKIDKIITDYPDEAKKYIIELMNNIQKHTKDEDKKIYTINDLKNDSHNRVKSLDKNRFKNDLIRAYKQESNLLLDYFSQFKTTANLEHWKQSIIQYVYQELTRGIRHDFGLGLGQHPAEEYPAYTMIVQESLLAKPLLDRVDNNKIISSIDYIEVFEEHNISSMSWKYVSLVANKDDAIIKLRIINKYLLNIDTCTRKDAVLYCYIGGLRKLAQYKILIELGFSENDAMDKLKDMNF